MQMFIPFFLTPKSLNWEITTWMESEKILSSIYKGIYLSFIFNNEKSENLKC